MLDDDRAESAAVRRPGVLEPVGGHGRRQFAVESGDKHTSHRVGDTMEGTGEPCLGDTVERRSRQAPESGKLRGGGPGIRERGQAEEQQYAHRPSAAGCECGRQDRPSRVPDHDRRFGQQRFELIEVVGNVVGRAARLGGASEAGQVRSDSSVRTTKGTKSPPAVR